MDKTSLVPVLALLGMASASAADVAPMGDAASQDPFVLTATAADWSRYVPPYLANGRVASFGSVRGTEPARSYLAGVTDHTPGDVSRPVAIPGWTGIDYSPASAPDGRLWLDATDADSLHFADYVQRLDLKRATLETAYEFHSGGTRTRIAVSTLASESDPHVAATRLVLEPRFSGEVVLRFPLVLWAAHQPRLPFGRMDAPAEREALLAHGLDKRARGVDHADRLSVWYPGAAQWQQVDGDARTGTLRVLGKAPGGRSFGVMSAIGLPEGLGDVRQRILRTAYTVTLEVTAHVVEGRRYEFVRYNAFGNDGWDDGLKTLGARLAAARSAGYARLAAAHEAAWAALWQADIRIEGDTRAQRLVHGELYSLIASVRPDSAMPVAACGLTTGYNGHAFWDGDAWIFQALLMLHPDRARSLVDFRWRTLAPAQARARARGLQGAMYPWESDADRGTEETPATSSRLADSELHVTAAVALAAWQYYLASGDLDWLRARGWPVLREVARFWASRVSPLEDGKGYALRKLNSVNESFADVDNDLYTNAAVRAAMAAAVAAAGAVGEPPGARWQSIAQGLVLPLSSDGTRHVDFESAKAQDPENWPGSALLLTALPSVDLQMTEAMRRAELDYASPASDQEAGNSMGYGPVVIAAAAAAEPVRVAHWLKAGSEDGTINGPFLVRAETPTNNTHYFMTGSASYLEAILYGVTGMRYRADGLVPAYGPMLPAQWRELVVQGAYDRGARVDLRVTRDAQGRAVLSRQPSAAGRPAPFRYEVDEGLNHNAFLREGQVSAHVLLRNGGDPRLLVALPAGNEGLGLWFGRLPAAAHWTLLSGPRALEGADAGGRTLRGVRFEASIDAPALRLRRAVLGNVRVLRDFEALGRTPPEVDVAPVAAGGGLLWQRDRLDGQAGFRLELRVTAGSLEGEVLRAPAGGALAVEVTALQGDAPLTPIGADQLLEPAAAADPASRHALEFLSYREKFMAGSWRFNTYFGRDTLLSTRLLQPVLQPDAVEAGLGAVIDRLSPQGEVAHEEDVGEFAVMDHRRAGNSTGGAREADAADAPVYDYKMIDGTFLLAPALGAWLLDDARAQGRGAALLARPSLAGVPRGRALVLNFLRVVESAGAFAANPVAANLVPLKEGISVGNWRDSEDGLGGGRYPYDVNAVLVPSALESIARFLESGLLDAYVAPAERARLAAARGMAVAWQAHAPALFEVVLAPDAARAAVVDEAEAAGTTATAALAALPADGLRFHALSLDAAGRPVAIMNSDEGFALLFGRPDDAWLRQAAATLRPFPAGLLTDAGMLVANPLAAPAQRGRFGRNAYHGTVVWSWQQALMAAGMQRQLARTDLVPGTRESLRGAQAALWRAIEATRGFSRSELWSWRHEPGGDVPVAFGAGQGDADESNAAQLWSTVYLAVRPPAN